MVVFLSELPVADPDRNPIDRASNLAEYIALPEIAQLKWPAEVIEQWLFDHGGHGNFLKDYADLELDNIVWTLEDVPVRELGAVRTGASEQGFLDDVARLHCHYLSVRTEPYRVAWETAGSWLVPPILVARDLLIETAPGMQLVEGRMRVGILQGRLVDELPVADTHKSWVGRARPRLETIGRDGDSR